MLKQPNNAGGNVQDVQGGEGYLSTQYDSPANRQLTEASQKNSTPESHHDLFKEDPEHIRGNFLSGLQDSSDDNDPLPRQNKNKQEKKLLLKKKEQEDKIVTEEVIKNAKVKVEKEDSDSSSSSIDIKNKRKPYIPPANQLGSNKDIKINKTLTLKRPAHHDNKHHKQNEKITHSEANPEGGVRKLTVKGFVPLKSLQSTNSGAVTVSQKEITVPSETNPPGSPSKNGYQSVSTRDIITSPKQKKSLGHAAGSTSQHPPLPLASNINPSSTGRKQLTITMNKTVKVKSSAINDGPEEIVLE